MCFTDIDILSPHNSSVSGSLIAITILVFHLIVRLPSPVTEEETDSQRGEVTSLGSHSWKEQSPDPNTGSCLSATALVIPAREKCLSKAPGRGTSGK